MAYCTNGYRGNGCGMNGNGGGMNGNGNGNGGNGCVNGAVDNCACGGISGGFSCVVNLIIILLVLEFLSQLLT